MDEANILMAMNAARQAGDCKVVAKINRKALVDLVASEEMIDSVVSASSVTTELIIQYVRTMQNASGSKVKTLHRLVDGRVEAVEFGVTADSPLIGVPLRDLPIKANVLIAGIVRPSGQLIVPSGENAISLGDDVIVVTTDSTLQDIRGILR